MYILDVFAKFSKSHSNHPASLSMLRHFVLFKSTLSPEGSEEIDEQSQNHS